MTFRLKTHYFCTKDEDERATALSDSFTRVALIPEHMSAMIFLITSPELMSLLCYRTPMFTEQGNRWPRPERNANLCTYVRYDHSGCLPRAYAC